MGARASVRFPVVVAMVFAMLAAAGVLQAPVRATPTPPSGSIGPASGSSTSWDFATVSGAGSGGTPLEGQCLSPQCDKYDLNIVLPQPDAVFYATHSATLRYRCSWTSPSAAQDDLDCFAFSPTGGETGPGSPDTSSGGDNFEELVINNPASGHWSLRVDTGAPAIPTAAHGIATLAYVSLPPGVAPTVPRVGDARFSNFDFDPTFQGTDGLGRPNAGEPSVGVDWETGKVMYMAGGKVTQLTYDLRARPPTPTAVDVTPANSVLNEDAILFTDRALNRTFAMGLLLPASYLDFTDVDGTGAPIGGWTPSAAYCGSSSPGTCGPDHETLASGPYHTPAPAHTYPHAVYYCAQTIVQDAYCGRSDDGGQTFNPLGAQLWHGACSPLHGHARVGPTGVVYVPDAKCTGHQAVSVSEDNGATFTVYPIPDSTPGSSDPSVMEDPVGNVYFTYQAENGHPMVAVSHNHGHTWDRSIDVGRFSDPTGTEDGLLHGVQNTEFAEVITGDAGRAAFAFLGTGTPGSDQDGAFPGTWYLFVSYTFDAGKTWRTVNATPGDPVQRGCVWNGGLVNACRNMLDFNDIAIDRTGHVYVAYTDGCTTSATYSCDKTPGIHGWNNVQSGDQTGCKPSEAANVTSDSTCTFARLSAIVRQTCGRGLTAAGDPGFNEADNCVQAASTVVTPIPVISGGTPTTSAGVGSSLTVAGVGLGGVIVAASLALRRRRRRRL